MYGRFGTAQIFNEPALIESYGAGVYAAYDQNGTSISKVTIDGVRTTVASGVGYGYGFDVLTDGAFLVYGLGHYGQETGASARVVNADGTARTAFFNAAPNEDLRSTTASATADGGFAIGATSRLHFSDPVTVTYPQDQNNGSTSATTGKGGDIVLSFFDGQGSGGTYIPVNSGAVRSYAGASAPDTYFEQTNGATLGLANGAVAEVFRDYIAVGNPIPAPGYGGGYNQQSIISLRIVTANGVVRPNIQVNDEPPVSYSSQSGDQVIFNPQSYVADGGGGMQVVSLGASGFAVVWHERSMVRDSSQFGGYRFDGTDTKIRYFDNAGNAKTDEIQLIHRSPALGNIPATVGIDALGDGRVALVYQDGVYGVNSSSAGQLFVKILGPLGAALETIAITPPPAQGRAYYGLDLASLGGGAFAVSYSGALQPYQPSVAQVVTFADGKVIQGDGDPNTLLGGAGPDKIFGLGGDDILKGYAGDDLLDGGSGADRMYGGLNDDSYVVDNVGDLVFETAGQGNDTVTTSVGYTLRAGQEIETLKLASTVGTGAFTLKGNEFANTLIGSAGANVLDGGGGADSMSGLGGADTYYVDNAGDLVFEAADGGNDTVVTSVSYTLRAGQEIETLQLAGSAGTGGFALTGNEFVNNLKGGAGGDTLDGGGAADVMSGAGGDDLYLVGDALDRVIEAAGGGNDTVETSVSYTLNRGQEIETLRLSASAGTEGAKLTGNEFGNAIVGGAGADQIDGRAGADVMTGLGGADRYFVDDAADRVIEAANGGSDTVVTTVSYTLEAGQEIETLQVSSGVSSKAVDLTGNAFANSLTGGSGANVLNGGAGKDILFGGAGADTFVFDALLGPDNADRIADFSSADDAMRLDQSVFAQLALGTLTASAFKELGDPGVTIDRDDRIIYNHNTGELFYDANGSDAGERFQFATLSTKPVGLVSADFFVVA